MYNLKLFSRQSLISILTIITTIIKQPRIDYNDPSLAEFILQRYVYA